MVEGTDSPTGGRQRTIYKLTTAGRHAVRDWHAEPAEHFDYRDEGLLKLFFAGAVAPGRAAEIAHERADEAAEVADELRAVEQGAEGKDQASYAVLRFGIDFNTFISEWFERQALAFEEGVPLAKLPSGEEGERR